MLKSKGVYVIPATIAGIHVRVITDVVDSNIPLLLSRVAMKRCKLKLDLEHDQATIFGKKVNLSVSNTGHYLIKLIEDFVESDQTVCAVQLNTMPGPERQKTISKLHRQFAHPSAEKLKRLLVDSRNWSDEFQSDLDKVYDSCEICKIYSRAPPRPAVSLPLASSFNEKVSMDLKKWDDRWILHMIDMWSRLSVSVFIDRKKPSDVVDAVMKNWVGAGYGVMEGILTDNGGEFNNDELRYKRCVAS